MKVLFFMAHAGHARNFESTLRLLAERGHDVVVAVDRTEKKTLAGVAGLLDSLRREYPNIGYEVAPQRTKEDWSEVGIRLRSVIDYMRYLEPEFRTSPKLRHRASRRVPPWFARGAEAFLVPSPRARHLTRRVLERAARGVPLGDDVRAFVAGQAPDVVLVTPLVELGSPQLDYLRCARALGIPSGLLVASWDNLTVKGKIQTVPDLVTVWNEAQKREAIELHGIPSDNIAVTGAAAYDHWLSWEPSTTREEFCRRVGLDPARPLVLYVGSSRFIAPNEASLTSAWATHLREALPEVQLVIRPHPTNPLSGRRASQVVLADLEGVTVYPREGTNPTDEESRNDYFDSIYHSAAVVGVNTSGMVESSMVDRPVHTLLTAKYRDTQRGTPHFHYLLPERGGMLQVATTLERHVEQLSVSVAGGHNGRMAERNREFVASFLRPHGADRPSAPMVVEAIEGLAGVTPASESRPGVADAAIQQALALGAKVYLRDRLRRMRDDKRASDEAGDDPTEPAHEEAVELPEPAGEAA